MTRTAELGYAEESSLPIAIWVVPWLGALLTPGLTWVVAERPMAIRWELAVGMSIGAGLVAFILLAILSHGFRHRIRWSLGVAAIGTLTLFQWPTLIYAGEALARSVAIPLLSDAAPVLFGGAFLWVAVRRGGELTFAVVAGVGITAMVAGLTVQALPYVVRTPPSSITGQAAADSPDVLLLVLDAYPRADVLEEEFGFDNTPFHAELEQLGFTVATEARANYNSTYAAVSGMFDMDYVYDVGEISAADRTAMRDALSGDAALLRRFREAGYEVAYAENAWRGSHCGNSVDICIRDGFVDTVLWALGRRTIFAPLLGAFRPEPFTTISVKQLDSLPVYMDRNRTEDVPRLTIAHIILPHPPLVFDADCGYHRVQDRYVLTDTDAERIEAIREFSTQQIACTNQKVVASVQRIIGERPDTVVMITADHGSNSAWLSSASIADWSDEAIDERMSIFSAYRIPGCANRIYPTVTPVNGIRTVTDCALGTNVGALPDNHFWVPSDPFGRVLDIAPRLAK